MPTPSEKVNDHGPSIAQLVEEALDLTYTNEAKFVEDVAREFAIANLGSDLAQVLRGRGYVPRPENLVAAAWDCFTSEADEESWNAMSEELQYWRAEAKKMVKKLGARRPTLRLAREMLGAG